MAACLYAGWTPIFCDIDPVSGNVPAGEWARAVEAGAGALLFVHLFGAPADPEPVEALCRRAKVYLIEDACQAVGASIKGGPCGSFGDISVVSFGHTKTIDVGSGGLVLTDDDEVAESVRAAAGRHNYLPHEGRAAAAAAAAAALYERKDAFVRGPSLLPEVFAGLIDRYVPLVPSPWEADESAITRGLASLERRVSERRRKADLYGTLLAGGAVSPLRMGAGAAPWRFCFRLPGASKARQEALSVSLRGKGVPVSNWYIPTHWMSRTAFPATGSLEGTTSLFDEIFQFWLDDATSDADIQRNCKAFLAALESVK